MIAVINYGMGNLGSVRNAFDYIGVESIITDDKTVIKESDALVLPGVGAFGDAMDNLGRRDLTEAVRGHIDSGKPFLGICLGLQMLFEGSQESPGVDGLGVFRGTVIRFPGDMGLKVPQIGWNSISTNRDMPVLGEFNGRYMYFVHSYYPEPRDGADCFVKTAYGVDFVSAVEKDNVLACQFHPEKSGRDGLAILKKWTDTYL